jgi:hypothetical protein
VEGEVRDNRELETKLSQGKVVLGGKFETIEKETYLHRAEFRGLAVWGSGIRRGLHLEGGQA